MVSYTELLESLLEGGEETPTFEIKGPMKWDAVGLAKDILAMSNVQDGGAIVIGVEDGTFERVGITPEIRATYNIDIMRDQIAPYADPAVSFGVTFPVDRQGRVYVAVEVKPFRDTPIICGRDGHGLHKGEIYYRSDSRRPQSARVQSSSDMRDIIELAIARRGQRLQRLGLEAKSDVEEVLRKERGDL